MKHLALFLFLITSLFGQNTERNVLSIDDDIMTLSEFKKRFMLTPLSSYEGSDEGIDRRNFLYSLAAEKLWAKEAIKYGLDTSEVMKTTYKAIEKMFLRDALFKKEIDSKVMVTEQEVVAEFQRALTYLTFNFLFSSDSSEIYFLHNELIKGVNIDSIFFKRDEAQFQSEPIALEYEKVERNIADILLSLDKQGEFTAPVKESSGWFIFICRERKFKDIPSNERQKLLSKVKDDLRIQKTDEIYQAFHRKYFNGKKIETDGILFWSLRDKIYNIFSDKKEAGIFNSSGNLKLDKNDFQKLENEFGNDSLALPFIKIENEPVTFLEFLRTFQYEGFLIDTLDANILAARLNFRIKNMIEQELLSREALLRGFNKLPEVEADIKMWKESYLYLLFRNSYRDSISFSENDLREYYEGLKNDSTSLLINVVEILTDSLEIIERIFYELKNGADFKNLARVYTIRTSTKITDGEFGFQPVYALGEIGRIALGMNVGEIYGPIKLAEGYSLFQLIGKKENIFSGESFTDAKEKLFEQLRAKKMQEIVDRKTVELARKYNLIMDEELVINSEIENYRMLTFRLMGFGGRIIAVPLTPLYYEWIEEYKKSQQEIP